MKDRRFAVSFDPDFFARRAAAGDPVAPADAFRHAYAENLWAGPESASGPGASLDQTAAIRRDLPALLHRLGVRTLLDLPCGDCHWMSAIDLGSINYVGADFLPELIAANVGRHGGPTREFRVLDLIASPLPFANLILCRDCLVHLSFSDIARALDNIRASGSTYLLTTTFPQQATNDDVRTGDWRPINLEAAPFHLPPPLELLVEGCTEGGGVFADKSLGLWELRYLRSVVAP